VIIVVKFSTKIQQGVMMFEGVVESKAVPTKQRFLT
jgi:hypothetical protein